MNRMQLSEHIESYIFIIRKQKVMLSNHLAPLYEVEPKVLMQSVKRNIKRFPEDFMFQLTAEETKNLKSQIVTSSWGGIRRATPYAFTQEGVAMLSGVLKSQRAIEVNITIMRAFVRMRSILSMHKELEEKLAELSKSTDTRFQAISELFQKYLKPVANKKPKIGFRTQ